MKIRLSCLMMFLLTLWAAPAVAEDCAVDEDCPEGFHCHGDVCVETVVIEPECEIDDDCPSGRICVNGKCVVEQPDPDCVTDEDCPADFICSVNGTCTETHGQPDCEKDEDCPDGKSCVHNQCVGGGHTGPPCSIGKDCGEGEACVYGYCETAGEGVCDEPADCADGQVCASHTCLPEENYCKVDEDCPDGQNCIIDCSTPVYDLEGNVVEGECVVELGRCIAENGGDADVTAQPDAADDTTVAANDDVTGTPGAQEGEGEKKDSGGCSQSTSSSVAMWLVLLALLALATVRRYGWSVNR